MKKVQKIRLMVQLLWLILTAVSAFVNFKAVMVIILLSTIVGGAYHCGWLCPFGTLQDIASKIGSMLKIKKYKMPKAIQRYLIYVRYILYGLFLVFSFDILFSLLSYDPRVNLLHSLNGVYTGAISLVVILSFLVIGMFFDRPFCNYLCIEGAKFGVFSSLRVFTIKRNEDSCVGCHKCDKVCPMNIEISKVGQVQSIQCINCFECVSACPVEHTLTYGRISLTRTVKNKYKIAAGVIGIAIIIAVISLAQTGELPFNIDIGIGKETSITTGTEDTENVEDTTDTTDTTNTTDTSDRSDTTDETDTTNTTDTSDRSDTTDETDRSDTTDTTDTTELTEAELAAIGDAKGIEDGIYEGSGYGFNGEIVVEVTISNQMITKIEVTKQSEDGKFYNRAQPTVTEDIIDSQSVEVDTVSGATYSSAGIIEAVTNALEDGK